MQTFKTTGFVYSTIASDGVMQDEEYNRYVLASITALNGSDVFIDKLV